MGNNSVTDTKRHFPFHPSHMVRFKQSITIWEGWKETLFCILMNCNQSPKIICLLVKCPFLLTWFTWDSNMPCYSGLAMQNESHTITEVPNYCSDLGRSSKLLFWNTKTRKDVDSRNMEKHDCFKFDQGHSNANKRKNVHLNNYKAICVRRGYWSYIQSS